MEKFIKSFVIYLLLSMGFALVPSHLQWTRPIACAEESRASYQEVIKNLPRVVLHKVKRGQNLHLLAAQYYNDARQWKRIFSENRDKIKNPNILKIGIILKITLSD